MPELPSAISCITPLVIGILISLFFLAAMQWRRRPPPRTKNDLNIEITDEIRRLRGRGIDVNSRRAELVINLMNFIDIHHEDDMGVFAVQQLIMLIADGSLETMEDERLLKGIPIATVRKALDDGDTLVYVFRKFRANQPNANFIVVQLMELPAE